ncbi:transposase [Kitasatospora purpeofusca]|uniref:transposase n=1 Tax=Kitasatospora purpeofusca TaxID=67352 RepID=UPI003F4AA87C
MPPEWGDRDDVRRRRTGLPSDVGHVEKWRLAVGMLEELISWGLAPQVVVADAGYGRSAAFRHALRSRDLDYVVAARGDETAHHFDAEPVAPACGGAGRRTIPRLPHGLRRPARARHRERASGVSAGHPAPGKPRRNALAVPGPAGTARGEDPPHSRRVRRGRRRRLGRCPARRDPAGRMAGPRTEGSHAWRGFSVRGPAGRVARSSRVRRRSRRRGRRGRSWS